MAQRGLRMVKRAGILTNLPIFYIALFQSRYEIFPEPLLRPGMVP